ncbi:ester cyclase [Pedobacter sp. B4-66]|uniref:nuclear transport factor 2 family protein n=1 Tax=Pedobacter sp. B4-66 TaxID=2817280 RepID=UPI001BD9E570|nr:ester cyclase [Pedobacter sp. B4-66]
MKKLILLLTLFGSSLVAASQPKRNLVQEEKNKKIVSDFFLLFYNDKDLEKAKKMMHPDFVNHHPYSGKGVEATINAVNKHLFGKFPEFKVNIKRITAEHDLVWIQCYTQDFPGDHGKMSMDIWRIKDGKIAEHWDIIQDIPKDITPSSMYD